MFNRITLIICKVHEISHYWKWVDEVFIPSLGPYTYYDGETPYESNFLADTPNAYLLGVARLRQLRIKKGKCCTLSIKHPCSSPRVLNLRALTERSESSPGKNGPLIFKRITILEMVIVQFKSLFHSIWRTLHHKIKSVFC